jgi:hypothetical protein
MSTIVIFITSRMNKHHVNYISLGFTIFLMLKCLAYEWLAYFNTKYKKIRGKKIGGRKRSEIVMPQNWR